VGWVARSAEPGFHLSADCSMCGQTFIGGPHFPGKEGTPVDHRRSCHRTIRALLFRRLELRGMTCKLITFCHAHYAMVLTVSATARGQARLTFWSESVERLDHGQAKKGQQNNRNDLAQFAH
jgi:hypothetical protein